MIHIWPAVLLSIGLETLPDLKFWSQGQYSQMLIVKDPVFRNILKIPHCSAL